MSVTYKRDVEFSKLKMYLIRLNRVIDELDKLEDFYNADYSDCATDLGFVTAMLEQRRDRLRNRGKIQ